MFHLSSQQIDEFEKALQELTNDIADGTIFEDLSPTYIWRQTAALVTRLKNLSGDFKEPMLMMKPEKTSVIEKLFENSIQALNAFKEILFQETSDPDTNSKLAIEQLKKGTSECSEFLDLAKQIRDNPSPIIEEILKLREVYETKEYLATVQAPRAFQERLNLLSENIDTLSASIVSLEKALETIKKQLSDVREASLKFRSATKEMTSDPKDRPIH